MISIFYENLCKISQEHGISEGELFSTEAKIPTFLENIKKKNQGFTDLPEDNKTLEKIHNFVKKTKNDFKYIVVLGIGGSALGTICLQQSLTHLFQNELKNSSAPKLYVIDNIDPVIFKELDEIIELEKTLFIVITKSGTTIETISQYKYYREKAEKEGFDIQKHFIFITDAQKGTLREIAKKENITTFEVPENVGGRFSVLSAVGLLPAALIEIDINRILTGAKNVKELLFSHNLVKNLPFQLAAIQYLLYKKGKSINVMMPYAQKLIKLSDWYKQLLAESIGKKFNNEGKEIFTGITPTSAIGVTDQHSQTQLYNEGPNDKLIIFIEEENHGTEIQIPDSVTFNKLLDIEKKSTEGSLTKNDRPNITININSVNEDTIGELIMLFECSVAFLGEFFEINAFDQPGVELTKELIKENLDR